MPPECAGRLLRSGYGHPIHRIGELLPWYMTQPINKLWPDAYSETKASSSVSSRAMNVHNRKKAIITVRVMSE